MLDIIQKENMQLKEEVKIETAKGSGLENVCAEDIKEKEINVQIEIVISDPLKSEPTNKNVQKIQIAEDLQQIVENIPKKENCKEEMPADDAKLKEENPQTKLQDIKINSPETNERKGDDTLRHTNSYESPNFPSDAENGLSTTKMLNVTKKSHPHIVQGDGIY